MRGQVFIPVRSTSAATNKNVNADAELKVYLAEDIQRFLGLGRSKTYEFLQEVYKKQEPFMVIKIGKLFRIPKWSFDNWLHGKGEV